MKRRTDSDGRGKALDLWQAPAGAGEPLLCLATTFTFDAAFFETECLGRFLQMDSHPQETEAVGYLIEREEKLAAVKCVAVLVDRRHAREKESLRWDVLPVMVPHAAQHAKVAVLAWADHVRLLVGSANLTKTGYRENVEVIGALDLSRQRGGPVGKVREALDFLDRLLDSALGHEWRRGPKSRSREALAMLRRRIEDWPAAKPGDFEAMPVFGGGGSRSVLEQVRDLWPSGSVPRCAHVLSPFFDADAGAGDAATALVEALSKRGERAIHFYVPSEELPDGGTRVFAPRVLIDAARSFCETFVRRVANVQDDEPRPLHAKMLVLGNDEWELWLLGSSNFTRAGLGIGMAGNWEANLAYRVRVGSDAFKAINAIWPAIEGEAVDLDSDEVLWQRALDGEGEGGDAVALPAAFREALFDAGPKPPRLILSLGEGLPKRWLIRGPDGQSLLDSDNWSGPEGDCKIVWQPASPPFVLAVQWESAAGDLLSADWPVNLVELAALPPPEALRNLSLEQLIEILSSTRPVHEIIGRVFKGRGRKPPGDVALDPHKRVNTETFLLRRANRVGLMLERLRERLERPVLTAEALAWRLSGPVGPCALAEAMRKDARHLDEACFFLAELVLALGRVRAGEAAKGGLAEEQVRAQIQACIRAIEQGAKALASDDGSALDRYVKAAFAEARR